MIVLDIETTGLIHNSGICEIGAINLEEPTKKFVQDCRIDKDDLITEEALKVNGRTKEELYNESKQTQKQLIENYLAWVEKQPVKIFFGQNVSWDISMIQAKCIKYGLWKKFLDIHGQRGIDLHTIAQERYKEIHKEYMFKETGQSAMNLGKILEFCGIPDKRISISFGKTIKEGKAHSALEDCKLEGEALYRIKFEKNLFPEYARFPIPTYLKK